MGGLTQPSPMQEEQERNWVPILAGIVAVAIIVGAVVFFSRSKPLPVAGPDPYAAYLKLTDIKMSAAQNFVGSTVTYVEGNVANAGNETVTAATVHVVFRDSLGQIVQADDVPLQVIEKTGPYPDAINLSAAPLAPGKSKQFRLTFEHISADWNQGYPELQVMHVTLK
jgi:Protein of unknown function (DUF2393)